MRPENLKMMHRMMVMIVVIFAVLTVFALLAFVFIMR